MLNHKILKPYPFCGGNPGINYVELSGLFYYVGCSHCLYKSCYCPTEGQSIRAWNERAEVLANE